jgi:hypothetical protein
MWNYRIIKIEAENQPDEYGLFEVIYNNDGEISAHSEEAELVSPSVKELLDSLRLMLDDAQKSSYNVLEMNKIKFAPLIDPLEDDEGEVVEIENYTEFMGLNPKQYKKQ